MSALGERDADGPPRLAVDHLVGDEFAGDTERVRRRHGTQSASVEQICLPIACRSVCLLQTRLLRSPRARLDRRLELAAGAVLPAADRAVARARARGIRHDEGVRADHRASLAVRHRARRRRAAARRRRSDPEDACDGGSAARAPRLRRAPRIRRRALARLARAADGRSFAGDPFVVRLRLRVRTRPARLRQPCGAACRRPGGDPPGPPRRPRRKHRGRFAGTRG